MRFGETHKCVASVYRNMAQEGGKKGKKKKKKKSEEAEK